MQQRSAAQGGRQRALQATWRSSAACRPPTTMPCLLRNWMAHLGRRFGSVHDPRLFGEKGVLLIRHNKGNTAWEGCAWGAG